MSQFNYPKSKIDPNTEHPNSSYNPNSVLDLAPRNFLVRFIDRWNTSHDQKVADNLRYLSYRAALAKKTLAEHAKIHIQPNATPFFYGGYIGRNNDAFIEEEIEKKRAAENKE